MWKPVWFSQAADFGMSGRVIPAFSGAGFVMNGLQTGKSLPRHPSEAAFLGEERFEILTR